MTTIALRSVKPSQGNQPASTDAFAPMEFGATKRIGFVLNAEGGLHWLQASEVLKNLRDVQHKDFRRTHLALLADAERAAFFPGAVELYPEAEAKESFIASDQNGHLYRSVTVKCDFAPDPKNPEYKPFSLSLFFAYTVCVQLPWAESGRRQLHSKFWYNAIVSPTEKYLRDHFDADLAILSRKIDELASCVMKSTLSFYAKGVNSVKGDISFVGAEENCRTIYDLCIEFPDEKFVSESAAFEQGKKKLSEANSDAMKYLQTIVTAARADAADEQQGPIFNVNASNIDTDVLIQRDYRGSRALYVVTSDGDLDGLTEGSPAVQRAFGVTSSYQPNIVAQTGSRAIERALHARPSNSISAIRVNIQAGTL